MKSAGSRRAAFSSLYDADGDAVTQNYNVSVEGYAKARIVVEEEKQTVFIE